MISLDEVKATGCFLEPKDEQANFTADEKEKMTDRMRQHHKGAAEEKFKFNPEVETSPTPRPNHREEA